MEKCKKSSSLEHEWRPCEWKNEGGGDGNIEQERQHYNWPYKTIVTKVFCIHCLEFYTI